MAKQEPQEHCIKTGEEYFVGFEYSGKIPSDATAVSSATVTAVRQSDESNADGILDSTTATITSNTQVTAGLDGSQEAGENYLVTFTSTLNNASADVLKEELLVKVDPA